MPDATLGPVTAWEYPDNPESQSITGDAATVWIDSDDATSTNDINEHHIEYMGETRLPVGYSAVPVTGLPLDTETAEGFNHVYATWTAWYSGELPGANPDEESVIVVPVLARGLAEEYGHNLKPRSTYSWDTESLHLTPMPQTFTRELIPDGGDGAYNFKTVTEILSNDAVYAPAESLRDDEFFVQMRVDRTLTDKWEVIEGVNTNTGSQVTVHVSEVTLHLGEPGPAPVVTTPGMTTMRVDWEIQPDALRSEVRIGDEITIEGEEPIPVINAEGGTFTFEGLEPVTTYTIGVRSFKSDGPGSWVNVMDQTLDEEGPVDPGEPGARPHYHRSIRDGEGNLKTYSEVTLLVPGTDDEVEVTIYSAAAGEGTRGSSFVAENGIVDFYVEYPMIVDILVAEAGGGTPKRFVNQWVGDPNAGTGGGGGGSGAIDSVNGYDSGDIVLTATDVGAIEGTGVSRIRVIGEYAYANLDPKDPETLYVLMMEVG